MMKSEFIKAVEENNLTSVRLFLSAELLLDPRGESFQEMRYFAESRVSNLYDTHDGKEFDTNSANWNEELMFSLKNDLYDNFSKERLDFYSSVVKKTLKEKAEDLDKEEKEKSSDNSSFQSNQESHSETHNDDNNTFKNVAIISLIAGALAIGTAIYSFIKKL